ncbi:Pkinase-domain-containing protein [Coemansia reversa NRRL 1564]|uniref:Pkinase-domain-containing protein n=1 Tax=Coemansia reversa (strain ATCC 12441 / NRRL 1564) TaxID=763665 RepID=A0A2G5BID2_COERN|nr:Pkinase-domain-containing protein [Coemansia reversa NRRL 1564]|eukprot:PIA18732.1 Pkinase-domain-containing protein [Coemansia reversa NRRL 1564]
MGIFSNRSGGDTTRTTTTAVNAACTGNGLSSRSRTVRGANGQTTALRRRRRSVDNFKDAQYALESSDDEPVDDGRTRRNSNAGISDGADADGGGFPAIDGYTVVGRIGEGAFSKVYRARQKATGNDVAIKAICKAGLTAVQTANIHKEIAIMESIHSKRVVRMIGVRETRDFFYLIMEFAEGGELFDRVLQLTYLSERLARHVIIQVAEAVQYLHANGIVQRDLKLENVVFEPIPVVPSGAKEKKRQGDTNEKMEEGLFVPGVGGGGIGKVKLIDFGLSKVVWNQATHTPCGTTGYAAPEVVRDELYTKSVDMWGLGCMLYAMVCGFPPFYDEDVKILTRKVALGQYEFLSPWWDRVNPQIKHLIKHLLELDPARRYTIQDFMRHPWIVEGVHEMYDSAAVAAAARSSVHKRRNTGSRLLQLGLRQPFAASPQTPGQFSPRNTMKNAYDLAFAMRRLGDDESAHQRYASTPTWDAAFGQHGIKSPGPQNPSMASRMRPREPQNIASGWVNIQALASPIQQRHCWQGTLGSPVDIHAADSDLNLISRVLDMPAKKHRANPRSKLSAVAAAAASKDGSSGSFSLNMGEATLLKRRFVA